MTDVEPGLPVPRTLFIEITTECNLRCKQCHMWRSVKGADALGVDDKVSVIDQFSAFAADGGVVFTGGEPFRETGELVALASAARARGLRTLTNTNGTYLTSRIPPSVVRDGPDVIVVSIDSHEPRTHDFIRGVDGAFVAAVTAATTLATFRDAATRRPTVFISAILCDLTLYQAAELVEFARRLGVDGITFQMLEPTFMRQGSEDRFFEKYWFKDSERARAAIAALSDKYGDDSFVLLSPSDFHWMGVHVDHPYLLPQPVCDSHERNVWVDTYGAVRLCAYMGELTDGRALGNVRHQALLDILSSRFATATREVMASCVRACGMLNCHRRVQPTA